MTFLLLLLCAVVVRAQNLAYYNQPEVGLPFYNAVPQSVYTGIPVTHSSGLRTSTFYGNAQFLSQAPSYHSYPSHQQQHFYPIPVKDTFVASDINIQKLQKPAIKTTRYELRRPALVELNHPYPKVQESSVVKTLRSGPVQDIHNLHVQPFAPAQPQFILTQQQFVPELQLFTPEQQFALAQQQFAPEQQFAPVQQQFGLTQQQFAPELQQFVPEQQFAPPQQLAPVQQFTSPATPSNDESIVVEAEQQSIQKSSQSQPALQQIQEVESPIARSQEPATETITQNNSDEFIIQKRLIELLTAKEDVADVKFDSSSVKNMDQDLDVNVAPKDAPIAKENVKTRSPIETSEETDVLLEPAAKKQ